MPIDNSTSVNTKNKADHPGGMTYARTRPAVNCCPSRPADAGRRGRLGAVAQMGERFRGTEEVRSSSLRSSTLVSPGAMAQSGSVLPSHGRGGSSILPSSTEPPAPHVVLVSMSSSLRDRPVPASAVRAETGDMLGRLKRDPRVVGRPRVPPAARGNRNG